MRSMVFYSSAFQEIESFAFKYTRTAYQTCIRPQYKHCFLFFMKKFSLSVGCVDSFRVCDLMNNQVHNQLEINVTQTACNP